LVSAFDGAERSSETDAVDLATRETVDLVFDVATAEPALLIASRQSLLPTYLLYQTFAYLGTSTGALLAAFERADTTTVQSARALLAALGGIDVLVPDGVGGWELVESVWETGPLAADVRMVQLPPSGGDTVRVRIRMAKGAWRLDAVGLVTREDRVEPIRLKPRVRSADGNDDPYANAKLASASDALVTFPGDEYSLVYTLPGEASHYELFLETKGCYLEWMREEWLAEEDLDKAAAMFLDPEGSLQRLAPEFKRVEPDMEESFWRSKYVGN